MARMSTLASRRRREEAGFRGRRSYIMGRERHAFEDAVHSTNGAAVLSSSSWRRTYKSSPTAGRRHDHATVFLVFEQAA